MATLVQLRKSGALCDYNPALAPGVEAMRTLDGSPRFVKWFKEVLPTLGATWQIELTPEQQLDDFLAAYAAGEPLMIDRQFKNLRPLTHDIWELKTGDLRLIGWFYKKDQFLCDAANTAQIMKDHNLYPGMIAEVVRFRNLLDLDEPKFVPGDDPHAVISNFTYP